MILGWRKREREVVFLFACLLTSWPAITIAITRFRIGWTRYLDT